MLGLFTFFYAGLHFVTYIWLDQFFDPAAIARDVIKRPFITIASPLLCCSSARLDLDPDHDAPPGRRWQLLHRLIYAIAVLGIIHYLWLVKRTSPPPDLCGILVLLLAVRLRGRGLAAGDPRSLGACSRSNRKLG